MHQNPPAASDIAMYWKIFPGEKPQNPCLQGGRKGDLKGSYIYSKGRGGRERKERREELREERGGKEREGEWKGSGAGREILLQLVLGG